MLENNSKIKFEESKLKILNLVNKKKTIKIKIF